jgi:hypothetical protein
MAARVKDGRGGARPGAGRKPLVPGRLLTKPLTVRFAERDYVALERAAARAGEGVADFVRRAVLRAIGRNPS